MNHNNTSKIFIILFAFVVYSCNSHKDNTHKMKEDLLGTWANLSMKITFQKQDSIFNVPEGQWENILKIKPILTSYYPDGRYESKYYNLEDSLLFTSQGNWALNGDSIYLKEGGITTTYRFISALPRATFIGLLDWNQDGDVYEIYEGVQVKINQKR